MTDANFTGVYFDPRAAADAAGRLDALAQRLHAEMQASRPTLTVPAAGADEVSLRAARTMNAVAESFSANADAGVGQLRDLATSLRAQVGHFGHVEDANVAGFHILRME